MPDTKKNHHIALTIAGSDPSGGAGVQADLKTFTAIGVYGGAVISSMTVQNTRGVSAVQAVDPTFVRDQIDSVLSDLNVSHIKIGMLGSGAVAESICEALTGFSGEIIYDPVLVSSSGHRLIDPGGLDVVRTRLLDICTVLTPNLPELSLLAAKECSNREMLLSEAGELLKRYGKIRTIIVTGGHTGQNGPTITDYLVTGAAAPPCEEIAHPRIAGRNTHGTGCTFSAAFTAYHLLSGNDSEAFHRATNFMDTVIKKSAATVIGHGTGPLLHHLWKE